MMTSDMLHYHRRIILGSDVYFTHVCFTSLMKWIRMTEAAFKNVPETRGRMWKYIFCKFLWHMFLGYFHQIHFICKLPCNFQFPPYLSHETLCSEVGFGENTGNNLTNINIWFSHINLTKHLILTYKCDITFDSHIYIWHNIWFSHINLT